MKCIMCGHRGHVGRLCNEPITEDIRDDVGYGVKPTGFVRTILVDTCRCASWKGV